MIIGYINHHPEIEGEVQSRGLSRCDKILIDSKGQADQLEILLKELREGDTLLFYSIRVFPLSTLELIKMMDVLNEKKVTIESVTEHLHNQFLFSILANFQREFRREASRAGVEGKRKRGLKGGRKKGLSKQAKVKAIAAAKLYQDYQNSIEDILKACDIKSKTTLYSYLEHEGIQVNKHKRRKRIININ